MTLDLKAAVVMNEAQFSKFVHEETHAGPRRADHLRKRLLADFRDHRLRFVILAKVGHEQEQPGKPFLTRIEQLIDKVRFDADGPAQKMGKEHLGERGSCWITRRIAAFSSRTIRESVSVATVAIRCACPARQPSPKKSFVPRIATTASLPCSETTVIFTLPFWM
jgi:hypothetical protein